MENNIIEEKIWYDGEDGYKLHKLQLKTDNNHSYTLELLDKPLPSNPRNIFEIFNDIFSKRQTKFIEILYSGGLDSEIVLYICKTLKLPLIATTMRYIYNGYILNTHDLYYAGKFCRENDIQQNFVDLNINDFYENGKYLDYSTPYNLGMPNVCVYLWLFEQCSGFPVFAGDYTWPWVENKVLVPQRYYFSMQEKFLQDRNIHGIGNMLNHSLELNLLLIKNHIDLYKKLVIQEKKLKINPKELPIFRQHMAEKLGVHNLQPRMRSFGFNTLPVEIFNILDYMPILVTKLGKVWSTIKWNQSVADILETTPGSNFRHGITGVGLDN